MGGRAGSSLACAVIPAPHLSVGFFPKDFCVRGYPGLCPSAALGEARLDQAGKRRDRPPGVF